MLEVFHPADEGVGFFFVSSSPQKCRFLTSSVLGISWQEMMISKQALGIPAYNRSSTPTPTPTQRPIFKLDRSRVVL